MHSTHRDTGRPFTIVAAIAISSGLFAALACGPGGLYTRGPIPGAAGSSGAGSAGNGDTLDAIIGSGGSQMSPGPAGGEGSGGEGGGTAAGTTGGRGGAAGTTGGRGGGGAAAGGTPQAGILSVDFVGGTADQALAGNINVAMQPDEIAGFKRAANWNSAPGPTGALPTLVASDGSRTAASVTWNAPMTPTSTGVLLLGYTDTPGDARMMNGVLNSVWSAVPATAATLITLSNLPTEVAAGGYDVYVYVLGGMPVVEERRYTYAIGSSTFNVTQIGPTPTTVTTPYTYVLAPDMGSGNYIVFRGIVGSTFTLLGSPSAPGPLRAPVNGLQVVWPSGA